MEYRRMGRSGLQLSVLSYGSWVTFHKQLDDNKADELMGIAYDNGINFFDNAEVYSRGESEKMMGRVLKNKKWDRTSYTVSSKAFWGCHRPDKAVPMEEVVWTMNILIQQGKILYWGTSEWSAQEIMEAHMVAEKYHLIGPSVEQPEYNLFHRQKMENDFRKIFKDIGMGTTIWSPLASGLLTGKYNEG